MTEGYCFKNNQLDGCNFLNELAISIDRHVIGATVED